MTNILETGALTTSLLPMSLRDYYESVLLDVLRSEAIYNQFSWVKEDFAAKDTKQMVLSQIFDLHPAIAALSEAVAYYDGAFMAGKTWTINVQEHGNVVKTNKFHDLVQFINSGDLEGLVRSKIGQNLVDTVDLLARNAYLTSSNSNLWYSGAGTGSTPTSRALIAADDKFDPDYADLIATRLESRRARGVDGKGAIVGIVHPRVAYDIRNSSDFIDRIKYNDNTVFFNGEFGKLGGIRFIKNTAARLPNAGATVAQTTLNGATTRGAGGPDSDDLSLLNYVAITSETDFAVGQEITVHAAALGTSVLETDASAEHRVIKTVETGKLYFTEPLLVDHLTGAYVTEARDVYPNIFIGGPAVCYAVAQRPGVIIPPTIDDFLRINRVSWYGVFKLQLLRDVFVDVCMSSSGITSDTGAAA